MKYAFAMLAAGGAVGAASQADAAVTVFPVNFSGGDAFQDISLFDGSPAQFYYGFSGRDLKSEIGAYPGAMLGNLSPVPGLPDPHETFSNTQVKTGGLHGDGVGAPSLQSITGGDLYVHLTFDEAGVQYVGAAHVDGADTLVDISYDKAAVPEPAAWALMIGGFGLAGATLRQRRRQPAFNAQ
ncbi:MAG: PEPxxWA-CTERM sorting domain-containing protein [Caulobacterales bacterium]|jgi:hypothetical protein